MALIKKVTKVNDFDDLVSQLGQIFADDNIDVDYVQEVMSTYKSNPRDWKKFAHFDRHR